MADNKKKIILITGANSGIGFDTAKALASASANNHVIMACRDKSKGQTALESLQSSSSSLLGTLSLLQLDITNDESISAAVAQLTSEFGRLDVLINNAGMMNLKPTDRRADLLSTYNTNAASPLILTEQMLPLLKESEDPGVVNVSSGLGSVTDRSNPADQYYAIPGEPYRMSKAAMNMATACMYASYKDWGCKVWSFDPGFVVTNLSGAENRDRRVSMGAQSSETSAKGLREIVEGVRDGEVGKFVGREGSTFPW
ncbi:hypothetical protein H2204_002842 [Knufia peltigerae]|uniref:Short chain dehydrogenase n=1 Tax=Knufia peltigerae TaxID=1002370 RepID=A0AA38YAI7_9EURO|nr:hypothetical protein H2204_002842 [Knufia peltigerae]